MVQNFFTGRSFQSGKKKKKRKNTALGFGKDKIIPSLKFLSTGLCLTKKKKKQKHLISSWQPGCNQTEAKVRISSSYIPCPDPDGNEQMTSKEFTEHSLWARRNKHFHLALSKCLRVVPCFKVTFIEHLYL